MATQGRLTIAERLLLAAYELDKGQRAFTAEDLVVAAWHQFPDTFGLAGHLDDNGVPRYPDSNRVYAEIMGSKPIRKKGFLRKVGRKMYELTDVGRDEARLLGGEGSEEPKKLVLSREKRSEVKRLLGTKAYLKFRDGRASDITFHDATQFWRVSSRSAGVDLEGRLNELQLTLDALAAALGDGVLEIEYSGVTVSREELEAIRGSDDYMRSAFGSEISTILSRKGRRR